MMKVPLVTPSGNLPAPQIDMGGMTAVSRAIQGFGEGLMDVSQVAARTSAILQQAQDRKDEITAVNKAYRASAEAHKRMMDEESKLSTETDHKEYMRKWNETWSSVKQETIGSVTDERTRMLLERQLMGIELEGYGKARAHADKLFVEENIGDMEFTLSSYEDDVKRASSLAEVEVIVKKAHGLINENANRHMLTKAAAEKWKDAWKDQAGVLWEKAKKDAQDMAYSNLVAMGTVDPGGMYFRALTGEFDAKLGDKKGAFMDAMKKAHETEKTQKKIELKEKEAQLREDDNRRIGDLFIQNKFAQAMAALNSPNITGGDKLTWSNAIESETKVKEEKVDPIVEATEYSRLSQLLLDPSTDKEKIRMEILTSRKLGKERRLELVRDVAQSYAVETRDNLKWGLDWIAQTITPKRGIAARIVQTTLESDQTMLAQAALKDWVKQQTVLGKPPSANDIRLKAMDLGEHYKPTFADRIKAMEEELKLEK